MTTAKAPVTPGLRPGYDQPAIEKCWNGGPIVESTTGGRGRTTGRRDRG